MQILDVTDARFKKYGRIVKNVDFTGFLHICVKISYR